MKPARVSLTHARARSRPGKTDEHQWALLRRLAEALPVVSIAAFGLGVVVNQLVFSFWGLSFLQIATPADVVMSGVETLLLAVLIVIAPTLAWSITPRATIDTTFIVLIILSVASIIIATILVVLAVNYDATFSRISMIFASNLILVGYVVLAKAIPFLKEVIIKGMNSKILYRVVELLEKFSIFAVSSYSFLLISVVTILPLAEFGFQLNNLYIYEEDSKCLGSILWIGDRSIVIACRKQKIG